MFAGWCKSVGWYGAAVHCAGSLRGAHAAGRARQHPAQHPPAPQRPTGKLIFYDIPLSIAACRHVCQLVHAQTETGMFTYCEDARREA